MGIGILLPPRQGCHFGSFHYFWAIDRLLHDVLPVEKHSHNPKRTFLEWNKRLFICKNMYIVCVMVYHIFFTKVDCPKYSNIMVLSMDRLLFDGSLGGIKQL